MANSLSKWLMFSLAAGVVATASGCGAKQDRVVTGAPAGAQVLGSSSAVMRGTLAPEDFSEMVGFGGGYSTTPIYTFVVTEKQAVSIEITAPADTILLLSGDGHPIFVDDTNGLDPAIYEELAPGVYRVFLGAWDTQSPVSYTLKVTPMTDEEFAWVRETQGGMDHHGGHPQLRSDPLNLSADPQLGPVSVGVTAYRGSVSFTPASDLAAAAGESGGRQGCYGIIDASRPVLTFSRGEGLTGQIEVLGRSEESDLIMAVVDDEGRYYCNDDFDGLNPGVRVSGDSASYRVFMGAYGETNELRADLSVRHLERKPVTTVTASIRGGELQKTVDMKGSVMEQNTLGNECPGYVGSVTTPNAIISVRGVTSSLEFIGRTTDDGVLTVVAPDGTVHCNDDTYGLQPAVNFQEPKDGDYRVFMGFYRQSDSSSMALELRPGPTLTANSRTRTLTPAQEEQTVAVSAGGTTPGRDVGSTCGGYFDMSAPQAVFELSPVSSTVVWSVDAPVDTVLMLRMPDGSFVCQDDSNGFNPEYSAQIGGGKVYAWIGTFSPQARPSAAQLKVSATRR